MIYCICLRAFVLELKALGRSPSLSLCEHHSPSYPHHHRPLSLRASLPPPPSPVAHPPLSKRNSEPRRCCSFGWEAWVPRRGRGTDVSYAILNKSVVSVDVILPATLSSSVFRYGPLRPPGPVPVLWRARELVAGRGGEINELSTLSFYSSTGK